jgi:F-type H+-transporting ATPase subunit gamma
LTNPRFVEHHVKGLRDIRAIMNSMKTLAYLETQKLSRIVPAQRAVTRQIDIAALDLLTHFPRMLPANSPPRRIFIVLGTERGFCGNFNQQLLQRLSQEAGQPPAGDTLVLLVGHKLHMAHRDRRNEHVVLIDGAGVAEEAPDILNRIVDEIESIRRSAGPASVSAICYGSDGELGVRHLLPPFREIPADIVRQPHEPLLNLAPEQLFLDLTDQSLFSSLFEILYDSLLTENHRRVQHLGDAVRHLDRQCDELTHRANALRQEQITEEIEVLLLSIGLPGNGARRPLHRDRRIR